MEPININYFGEKFNRLQSANPDSVLNPIRKEGFNTFNKSGLPGFKNEEWKYTRISNLFNKEYHLSGDGVKSVINISDINAIRLPGFETVSYTHLTLPTNREV